MSQREQVIQKLKNDGMVSRNWALKRYISRLGALIFDLKEEGWEFDTKRRGGDYIYELKKKGKSKDDFSSKEFIYYSTR